jgi:hypothetical protein
METVIEECTTEEQRSVVLFFFWTKDSILRIFIKKCFLFIMGSVWHVKRLTSGARNVTKHFADDEEVGTEVQNWLKQQRKDFS